MLMGKNMPTTYVEIQDTKKAHSNIWIPSRPNIHQHYSECLSKEQQTNEKCKYLLHVKEDLQCVKMLKTL